MRTQVSLWHTVSSLGRLCPRVTSGAGLWRNETTTSMRKDGDETVTDKDLVQCQCPLCHNGFYAMQSWAAALIIIGAVTLGKMLHERVL